MLTACHTGKNDYARSILLRGQWQDHKWNSCIITVIILLYSLSLTCTKQKLETECSTCWIGLSVVSLTCIVEWVWAWLWTWLTYINFFFSALLNHRRSHSRNLNWKRMATKCRVQLIRVYEEASSNCVHRLAAITRHFWFISWHRFILQKFVVA